MALCLLASGGFDNTVCIYDATTYAHLNTIMGHTGWVRSVTFTSDSSIIISGSDDKTIRGWDVTNMEQVLESEGHSDSVTVVAASPNDAYIASGIIDETLLIWAPPPSKGDLIRNLCVCISVADVAFDHSGAGWYQAR